MAGRSRTRAWCRRRRRTKRGGRWRKGPGATGDAQGRPCSARGDGKPRAGLAAGPDRRPRQGGRRQHRSEERDALARASGPGWGAPGSRRPAATEAVPGPCSSAGVAGADRVSASQGQVPPAASLAMPAGAVRLHLGTRSWIELRIAWTIMKHATCSLMVVGFRASTAETGVFDPGGARDACEPQAVACDGPRARCLGRGPADSRGPHGKKAFNAY